MLQQYFEQIEWKHAWVLWCLALLPLIFILQWRLEPKYSPALRVTQTITSPGGWKIWLRPLPAILRTLAAAAIIIALARPQQVNNLELMNTEGIDVMLCLDISGSMMAEDMQPTRLEAAKQVAAEFVSKRPNDRIGLVVFSAEAFTACPVTGNHEFLTRVIYETRSGLLKDGTHIGEGLGASTSGLEKSKAKSKVIILLTDGVNDPNAQDVSPEAARELAKSFGIRVYTIGAGTDGRAPIKTRNQTGQTEYGFMENAIDEALLKNIAKETGGQYFRAKDNEALQTIYAEIDKMEKVKIESTRFKKIRERFFPFVWAAIGLLFFDILLRYTWFRKFP